MILLRDISISSGTANEEACYPITLSYDHRDDFIVDSKESNEGIIVKEISNDKRPIKLFFSPRRRQVRVGADMMLF